MGVPIGLVFDCAGPARAGVFWRQALGHVEQAPPEGCAGWEEYDVAKAVPEGNEFCLV